MTEPQEWNWLESTKKLQEQAFGFELPIPEGEELVNYVIWNHSALVSEASELLDEFRWKPWAKGRGTVNRALALKEAVDVGHFLANILVSIGITDEEWRAAYQAKQQVNRDRMSGGTYDGVSSKCPNCKRAYDDGIECFGPEPRKNGVPGYCGEKHIFIVNEEETCPGCARDYADAPNCYTADDPENVGHRIYCGSLRKHI